MKQIIIEVVENGFMVRDGMNYPGTIGDVWVFETAQGMSDFIYSWGVEQQDPTIRDENARSEITGKALG